MGTRPGTLLERDVQKIFKLAGFTTHHQAKIKGYEIDVLAETDEGLRIIIECKQYENAQIEVRNLIHQWDSKNKEIQANKILLVIYGINITPSEKSLAHKLGITIWDKKDVEDYLDYVIEYKENAKQHILNKLKINLLGVQETPEPKPKETIQKNKLPTPKDIYKAVAGENPSTLKKLWAGWTTIVTTPVIGLAHYQQLKHPTISLEDKRLLHRGNQEALRELPEEVALDIKILRDECRDAIEKLPQDKEYERKEALLKKHYANQIRQIIQQHTE